MDLFIEQQHAIVHQCRLGFLPYLYLVCYKNKEQLIHPCYFCFAPQEIIDEARECQWFIKSSSYGVPRLPNEVGSVEDVRYILDENQHGLLFVTGTYFRSEDVTFGDVKIPRANRFEITILKQ